MEEWQLRLEHEKVVRDALLACGNKKASEEPDGPGYLIPVTEISIFIGKTFWKVMEKNGHNKSRFEECQCFKT